MSGIVALGRPRRGGDGQVRPLSNGELLAWGAVGGFFFMAVKAGLLDYGHISAMLEKSRAPSLQLASFIVFAITIIGVGAAWARLHRPVLSALVAVQLGAVAPMAITATVAAGSDQLKQVAAVLAPLDGLIVAKAYAQSAPGPSGPSTVECIVKSIVHKPC